jgi:ABC-type multidrug transport system ATPase subunit
VAPLAQAVAVSKRFTSLTVVRAVDLAIGPGEVVGLLGANGAGKTTLIRMLLGLVEPSEGTVRLFDERPSRSTRQRIGYVPQTLGLYQDLTVSENWDFAASAYATAHLDLPPSIAGWGPDLAGSLPLGTMRRIAFALARLHHPDLYVLDEPTSGVGPLGAARLWQEVRACAERGAGVLVTTHNMDEAEQCDRLVVMVEGAVAAAGTIGEIVGRRTTTTVRGPNWQQAFLALEHDGVIAQVHGDTLRVAAPRDVVEGALERHGVRATLGDSPANLEEAFVDLVTHPAAA